MAEVETTNNTMQAKLKTTVRPQPWSIFGFHTSGWVVSQVHVPWGSWCSPCLRGEMVFGAFITTEVRRTLRMRKYKFKIRTLLLDGRN
jgi:hypothetical protein